MCIERWQPHRREVVIGAAATLLAGPAAAQAPADDPAAERLTFPNGAHQVRAMLYRPSGEMRRPLVLVAHGDPGFPAYLRSFCGALSHHGWAVMIVDWTYRMPPPPGPDTDRDAWQRSVGSYRNWRGDDLSAARDWAISAGVAAPGRAAAIGFCGGGVIAAHFAAGGAPLAALVLFHTPVRHHGRLHDPADPRPDVTDIAARIRAPVQAHFGEDDPTALPADGRELDRTLRQLGRYPEFYYYRGAGHGFLQSGTPMNAEGTFGYAPEAARSATARAKAFLERHLRSPRRSPRAGGTP